MKEFFRRLFFESWQRKLISIILAVIIWIMVNQSLIATKTISNIPVRVINIPPEKTIVELQSDGTLTKRVTLTLVGNKTLLDELNSNDLEVVLDAAGHKGEWVATISRRNLSSLNPELNLLKGVSRVSPANVIIRLTKLVSEKIPVFITQPIGEPPRDYQYLDVWPYQLTLNVSGPEEVVKRLKTKGVRLTFDLSDISKAQLDTLHARADSVKGDEVSFFVPDQWKRVSLPLLSDTPIEIDDPRAKDLRIDFVRVSLIPINSKLPVDLFFPTEALETYNPKKITMAPSPLIEEMNGLNVFSKPLYAKGVSHLFVRVVEEMVQMTVIVDPAAATQSLNWSVQFINPRLLEDRYVSRMMSDVSDEEVRDLQPLLREEYLRNRFRSYMTRFQLFNPDDKRLELLIKLENDKVLIEEGSQPLPHNSIIKAYDPNHTP
ncbi:MAG: hypothetical protein K940chlam2_00882 [Chlamydiae bacterium]|nr:hypothetical protein [Chlamydiota bacterium]